MTRVPPTLPAAKLKTLVEGRSVRCRPCGRTLLQRTTSPNPSRVSSRVPSHGPSPGANRGRSLNHSLVPNQRASPRASQSRARRQSPTATPRIRKRTDKQKRVPHGTLFSLTRGQPREAHGSRGRAASSVPDGKIVGIIATLCETVPGVVKVVIDPISPGSALSTTLNDDSVDKRSHDEVFVALPPDHTRHPHPRPKRHPTRRPE